MSSSSAYTLAILLTLKDAASGGLDRFEDKLHATGKEGRALLQTVQDLRKDIRSGLSQAGVGVTILAGLKKGVDAAGEYEAALLDLKSAYQEVEGAGGLSASTQAHQLNQLEALAVRLGNRLQGTTQDYVQVLTALKQAGVDTETVLNGAGEAAANFANVSGAVTRGMAKEQAKEIGQFGKLFNLKGEDFLPSVNLISALKDRFDIDSNSLVEASKYFNATAVKLDLKGIGGASDVSKFFALLKRQGALEGSQAGTSATSYFQQLIAHADKVQKLKKETGIDLQLFDPKTHEFKGMENAFKQMEQFRKLKGELQLEKLNELFGEQGGKVAGIMVESGAEGWKLITTEAKKAVSLNEKNNQLAETYNAKWESLTGTLTNFKATVFSPLLDVLKPILDVTNSTLGKFQEWAKTHPEISKLVTTTAGMIGVLLTIRGSIRAASAAWKLYQIASATALDGAGVKAGWLATKLSSLPKTVQLGLALGAGWLTLEKILEMLSVLRGIEGERANLRILSETSTKTITKVEESYAKSGGKVPQREYDLAALGVFSSLNMGKELENYLAPERQGFYEKAYTIGMNPFRDIPTETRNKLLTDKDFTNRVWQQPGDYGVNLNRAMGIETAAEHLSKSAKELSNPNVMLAFRRKIDKGDYSTEAKLTISAAMEKAFPASYSQASQINFSEMLAQGKGLFTALSELNPPIEKVSGGLSLMVKPANDLPSALQRSASAADNFTNTLNSLKFSPDVLNYMPAPGSANPTPSPSILSPSLDNLLPKNPFKPISSNLASPSSHAVRPSPDDGLRERLNASLNLAPPSSRALREDDGNERLRAFLRGDARGDRSSERGNSGDIINLGNIYVENTGDERKTLAKVSEAHAAQLKQLERTLNDRRHFDRMLGRSFSNDKQRA